MPEATITVETVTTKEGAKDGKPWKRYSIKDGNGTWYSTFTGTVGEQAQNLQGKRAKITYTTKGEFKNLETIEDASEPARTIDARTDTGEADWDLIGLRKTRCALWNDLLPVIERAALAVPKENQGDLVTKAFEWAKYLVAQAERDIFFRDPPNPAGLQDEDLPF